MKSDKPAEAPKVVGKIELDASAKAAPKPAAKPTSADAAPAAEKAVPEEKKAPAPEKPTKTEPAAPVKEEKKEDFMPTQVRKLSGPTVVGKIDLPVDSRNGGGSAEDRKSRRKKRKRIKKDKEKVNIAAVGDKAAAGGDASRPARPGDRKPGQGQAAGAGAAKKKAPKVKKRPVRAEVSEEDVARQIKDTLARLTTKGKSKASRHRRDKRDMASQRHQAEMERMDEEKQTIKATEFVTANELANMMDVPVTQIIASCMSLGLFVSINQRLDAETIALVSEEFGFKVEFVSADVIDSIVEEEDDPADLQERPAIVTVMGHVDHGKTSLLDYIRKADVTAGEAGGITQHIGAYSVKLESGRQITFLDTPGHEAFTAMRARGAQVIDVAIIIVAADDDVMPQTKEAISHAQAAGVPMVFAINKIDKPGANPDKIKEQLSQMNILIEEWGGKYQAQEISAKHGKNIDELLEKVILEADMLELKANPNKNAIGTVLESSLDKGKGYVTNMLVEAGTLKVGDIILAGKHTGRVRAMLNEKGKNLEAVPPSSPVSIIGINGAPNAGDKFYVMNDEREARNIATRRDQLYREQGLRTQKHITLDEIGRRLAIGDFKELNIIVKGDMDGSIEALSDSLLKLSTEEIQVKIGRASCRERA